MTVSKEKCTQPTLLNPSQVNPGMAPEYGTEGLSQAAILPEILNP